MTLSHLFGRLGALGIACLVLALSGAASAAGPGPEVCQGCHQPYVDTYAKSIHGQKGHPASPASAGECSSCHGDGTAHVNAGGGRGAGGMTSPASKSVPAEQRSAACLNCHQGNRNLAFWDSGKHRRNDVSCSDCHSIHAEHRAGNDKLLKVTTMAVTPIQTTVRQLEYETCNGCHRTQRMEMLKPSHHPIVEGKVKCSSCHNPHGTPSPAMIKGEEINDLCLSCHTDKRGPWIHEHPPVEESCLSCHTPHGSQHNRLLTQKAPQLCSDCHPGGHTHGIYDGRSNIAGQLPGNVRFISSGCVDCHRAIHGSNAAPSGHGNFFIR